MLVHDAVQADDADLAGLATCLALCSESRGRARRQPDPHLSGGSGHGVDRAAVDQPELT